MIHKNGEIYFWHISRIGGSLYRAKARRSIDRPCSQWSIAIRESGLEIAATLVMIAALIGWGWGG